MRRAMVGVLAALGTALAAITELIHGHLVPVVIFGAAAATGLVLQQRPEMLAGVAA